MLASLLQTLSIQAVGAPNPSRLTQAGATPMRCAVRNTGGTTLLISHEIGALTDLNSLGGTYQLPAGQADIFVLMPGQSIFASAVGGGGQASIAISVALPVTNWLES